MVSFIDNVIVRTEEKKGYDKVVEKVVKRLVENNLYVKLEKYKWKVQEVGFLGVGVMIKSERIKMKEVSDWPTFKGVKNIQNFIELMNYYQWFIKDFVVIARPLHNLVNKYYEWDWIERQKEE